MRASTHTVGDDGFMVVGADAHIRPLFAEEIYIAICDRIRYTIAVGIITNEESL